MAEVWVESSRPEIFASSELGVLTYKVYAENSHLPSILMVWSGIPTWAAVVAAPTRKLWPLYREGSTPLLERALLTPWMKWLLVRVVPSG